MTRVGRPSSLLTVASSSDCMLDIQYRRNGQLTRVWKNCRADTGAAANSATPLSAYFTHTTATIFARDNASLQVDENDEFNLTDHLIDNILAYAILSHTWGEDHDEVNFKDLTIGPRKTKAGYKKLRFCAEQAAHDDLKHFWVDTCCIDKSSSAELTEAMNSMFRWYQDAARCYVYLSDVSVSSSVADDYSRRWKPAFERSRSFARGWT